MSFVGSPFWHDVFISYSHGDVSGDGKALLRQWSQGFAKQLERELQAYPEMGSHIRVFLDSNHRPSQGIDPLAPISDKLEQEIAHAAILSILMSPQYLGSNWCRLEREWWIEAQSKQSIDYRNRVAIARVWPTDPKSWPEELADRLGCYFFDREREDVRPQPFSWPRLNSETMGDFRDALLDYVGDVRQRLREIRLEIELRKAQEEDRQRRSARAGQVLYLHGRETDSTVWERVQRELDDNGYVVFPVRPEHVESDPKRIRAVQNERVAIMSGCDAVLVLGTEDISALTADIMVIGRLDRSLAVARSDRLLPCGVVDTVGVARDEPALSRKAKNLDVDWFDASIPPWTPQIQTWLHGACR
jgi:TIR domain